MVQSQLRWLSEIHNGNLSARSLILAGVWAFELLSGLAEVSAVLLILVYRQSSSELDEEATEF